MLEIGFFHADPHPGNVFAISDGTLGLIDFGAVGRLDSIEQSAVTDILAGLVTRDVGLMRNGIERTCDLSDATSAQQLDRALARLMADHVRSTGMVEPTVLQDLVSTLSRASGSGSRPTSSCSRVRSSHSTAPCGSSLPTSRSFAAATDVTRSAADAAPVVDPEVMVRNELMSAMPHLLRLPDRIDRVLTLTRAR